MKAGFLVLSTSTMANIPCWLNRLRPRSRCELLWYLYLDPREKQNRKRVDEVMPMLCQFRRASCSIADEMRPIYKEYISKVSSEIMAISFELACFLWSLCETTRPRRILDLGSGFSSFVLRRYQLTATARPEVWSVDESPQWLEKTRAFLDSYDLPDDNLVTLDEFRSSESICFDLIFHDLGNPCTRTRVFDEVLALRHPEGLVVLDDVHRPEYLAKVVERLRMHDSLEVYSLKGLTLDKYRRYSAIVQ